MYWSFHGNKIHYDLYGLRVHHVLQIICLHQQDSDIRNLMMMMESISEISLDLKNMTWLQACEDFTSYYFCIGSHTIIILVISNELSNKISLCDKYVLLNWYITGFSSASHFFLLKHNFHNFVLTKHKAVGAVQIFVTLTSHENIHNPEDNLSGERYHVIQCV